MDSDSNHLEPIKQILKMNTEATGPSGRIGATKDISERAAECRSPLTS